MSTKVQDGIKLLRREGITALASEMASYAFDSVYFAINNSHHLSLNGATVEFSAPTRDVARQHKRRFNSEQRVLSDLLSQLRSDDVFYDIGANTGLYTLFAALACQDGTVVAFEPYGPNADLLERDIERNQVTNVAVERTALSNKNGTVEFSQPPTKTVGYGSASISAKGEVTTQVSTATGDELVANGSLPAPNIIKVDVEGAEPLVIDGMETVLSSPACRTVYCEVHQDDVAHRPSVTDFKGSLDEMTARFRRLGFTVERLEDSETESFLKATK